MPRKCTSNRLISIPALIALCIALLGLSSSLRANETALPFGAVFTMDNNAAGNSVHVYHRAKNGRVSFAQAIATGGEGSGDALGNQGALQIDPSESNLYAVNAGSQSISVFRITPQGLALQQTIDSRGLRPISLTVSSDRVYVLNAGGTVGGEDAIAGFIKNEEGLLEYLSDSSFSLSESYTRPAQIGLSPSGSNLVVTERETHKITVIALDETGRPNSSYSRDSEGLTPFGFEFGVRDSLVIAEGVLGLENASSVSSYSLGADGDLDVLTSSALTRQTAACWLALSTDKKIAYTTNPGSDSISHFSLDFNGQLELQRPRRNLLRAGDRPLDIAVSRDNRALYVVLSGADEIGVVRLSKRGRPWFVSQRIRIPEGANGLVVI